MPKQLNRPPPLPVALRKESVDRNGEINARGRVEVKSLSARRAWIEIKVIQINKIHDFSSLSARRAWIEIEAPSSAP